MANFYIDPSLSTNGSGSSANPHNTPPTISSNNSYFFKRGTTYSGGTVLIPSSAVNVTVGAYFNIDGSDDVTKPRPIIDPKNTVSIAFRVAVGCTGAIVQDLEITGGGTGASGGTCLYVGSGTGVVSNNVTIRRCILHNPKSYDLDDSSGIKVFGNNVLIEDCEVHSIPDDGIWVEGLNAIIRRNYVHQVGKNPNRVTGDCIQINGDTASGSAGSFQIIDNILDHTNLAEKQVIIVSGALNGNGGLIANNICTFPISYNQGPGNSCIFSDQPGTIIERNTTYGGVHGILADRSANISIRNNLIIQAFIGINTSNNPVGLIVENNTVVNCLEFGGYFSTNDITTNIRNNVFFNCNRGLASHGNITKIKNSYYNNFVYNWASITGGGSIEGDAVIDDPKLTTTFTPKINSPLIGAATHVRYTRDRRGRQKNNPPTIGAFEYTTRGVR